MDKIALGTAQFGMDYGICNSRGQIRRVEVFEILDSAVRSGIDTLDTARSYGEGEEVIGSYLKSSDNKLRIITKLSPCEPEDIERLFTDSLEKLNCNAVEGCLIHNFSHYIGNKGIWKNVENIKRCGKTKKIGFSLYYPHELESIFKDDLKIDIVQIPLNIFDQRFCDYLPQLKKRNVEIHARSVFLQGLVFEHPRRLDAFFDPIKNKLGDLNDISKANAIPIFALCLNFVAQNKLIDKIVVGIDAKSHLEQILGAPKYKTEVSGLTEELTGLRIDEEDMILPFRWKLQKRSK